MEATFIVGGEEIVIDMWDGELLREVMEDALVITKNTARPLEDWELRYENGVRIAPELYLKRVAEFGAHPTFYMSPLVGAGGSFARPLGMEPRTSG